MHNMENNIPSVLLEQTEAPDALIVRGIIASPEKEK